MSRGVKGKVDINKKPYKQSPYADDAVQITITSAERAYLTDIAVIMSKLKIKETNTTLLPDKTLSSLGKMALIFMTNIYCTKVFTQSEVAANLPDKQARVYSL